MRIFYLFLFLLGCLFFPGVTYADYAYEFTSGDLKYGVLFSDVWDESNETWYPSDNVEVSGYADNYVIDLKVPSNVTYNDLNFKVVALGWWSLSGSQTLASVELPSSIKVINARSFDGCSMLQSIKLSEGLEEIGGAAFEGCGSLKTIDIPSSVKVIYLDNYDSTFGCFSNCFSLEAINVSSDNSNYSSIDGVLYDKSITTLLFCPEAKKTISLPTSLTLIYRNACENCRYLTEVIIPDKIEKVGDSAFSNCNSLEKVKIGKVVKTIGSFAFFDCFSLKEIEFGVSLETIEEEAFHGCGFEKLTLPDGLKIIDKYAFSLSDNLEEISFPSSLEFLGERPFYNSKLKSIDLSDTKIESLSSGTFSGCGELSTVSLPQTLRYISGSEAFEGCRSLSLLECNALTPPSALEGTFEDYLYSQCSLVVPASSLTLYQTTSPWSNFQKIIDTQYIGISEVSISAPKTVIGIGETIQLTPIVSPSDADSPTYIWEVTENPDIAEVDESGLVKPLNPGKVVIKLTAENYGGSATAEVEIYVVEIEIFNLPDKLYVGNEWQLFPQIYPIEFEGEEIIWLSSNPQIISVENNGIIKAVSAGMANISVSLKAYPYIEATYELTVDKIMADHIEIISNPGELNQERVINWQP